jgi:hypothetical protein
MKNRKMPMPEGWEGYTIPSDENPLMSVITQLRDVFATLGLSGMTDILDNVINPDKDVDIDAVTDEIRRWNSLKEWEDLGYPEENKKTGFIELFDTVVSTWDIHNIVRTEDYDYKAKRMSYKIVLNSQVPESARSRLIDYELCSFDTKEERDVQYRFIKNKLRIFTGINIK